MRTRRSKAPLAPIGRFCHQREIEEVRALERGMDFRLPQYRREVFLRFYEFHLRYRSHPGCVYYVMPELARLFDWSIEDRLWFAFVNGNTQNPVTSLIIVTQFPTVSTTSVPSFRRWLEAHDKKLFFDTDRRYFKQKFAESVDRYRLLTASGQEEFFKRYMTKGDPEGNFRNIWDVVRASFLYFGRLSAFSYLEYLSISGLSLACDSLFLHDMDGSKSHRNGLCKVLGRDDLDWHDSNPSFDGGYTAAQIEWLTTEASDLLAEARSRAEPDPHVGYFTLESALCTYKSWHRPNRRYPNVYNDMLNLRINEAELKWDGTSKKAREIFDVFWSMRARVQPTRLLLEHNVADLGLHPTKQNHYLKTGQPVMMDVDWPCFKNDYNDGVRAAQGAER